MLQEVKDLQNRAVNELFKKAHGSKLELTFRAPTGSGKTHMMAEFMNRLLAEQGDIVFLVSALSRGELARQNYEAFQRLYQSGVCSELKPYLINTEVSGEEELFIPTDYNVYVLPIDLYKSGGILMRGSMDHFLRTMTDGYFKTGLGRKIYLIKDECHVLTSNLDERDIAKFFTRTFNFTATPKLSRGQMPDVMITDEEAEAAHLIKGIKWMPEEESVDEALDKLVEIKSKYNNLLKVNPCLIIQISNKDKAEEEWSEKIKPALDRHQALKWMVIVDSYKTSGARDEKKLLQCDTNDDVKKKLPVSRWKDYAKGSRSTIDVIVFKMVISEGWDIPRACMLYQVRDTQSKQLDEQVLGRVRRNPRLLDYEQLSPEAQELASTAWAWGIKPDSMQKVTPVRLWKVGNVNVQEQIRVRTTKLVGLIEKRDFDIQTFMASQRTPTAYTDIFTLYKKMQRGDNALRDLAYDFAGDEILKWWQFMEHYDKVKHEYDTYVCDYSQSMVEDKETSFPVTSTYMESSNRAEIDDWIWCRKDSESTTFAFDSDAEREWANFLYTKIAAREAAEVEQLGEDERYLWGKNFPYNSEIKYEYYSDGIHKSYPDFVLKDTKGRIHIFEVKSLNGDGTAGFDPEEYEVLSADRKDLIRDISFHVTEIKRLVKEMTEARKQANHMEHYKECAFAYDQQVKPYLEQIRDHIDKLEMEIDDEIWPLPKYRELLFTK